MSKQLYTPADIKKVREQLYREQEGKDALTGLPLDIKQAVTDHNHKTQYVRSVLHRQTNAVVGKIENLWTRYLSYWYSGSLSDFLRKVADYIERDDDVRFIHPGFLKALQIDFNKLSESGKKIVLKKMQQPEGSNTVERKKIFKKALLTRQFQFGQIRQIIQQAQKGN